MLMSKINKNMKQAKIGVSVIILRENNNNKEILIGKRKGSHGSGEYSVPGGHLEYGETYNDTCSRELEEEIGVSFDSYTKLGFSEDFFGEKHYTTLYFLADNVNPNIKVKNLEPNKCEEWIWCNINNLPKLFCDTNNIIKKTIII